MVVILIALHVMAFAGGYLLWKHVVRFTVKTKQEIVRLFPRMFRVEFCMDSAPFFQHMFRVTFRIGSAL